MYFLCTGSSIIVSKISNEKLKLVNLGELSGKETRRVTFPLVFYFQKRTVTAK